MKTKTEFPKGLRNYNLVMVDESHNTVISRPLVPMTYEEALTLLGLFRPMPHGRVEIEERVRRSNDEN